MNLDVESWVHPALIPAVYSLKKAKQIPCDLLSAKFSFNSPTDNEWVMREGYGSFPETCFWVLPLVEF